MKKLFNAIALLLVFILTMTPAAQAADDVTPYASKYFDSYSVSLDNEGTTLYADYDVFGTGIIDKLGAKTVYFQRSTDKVNWTTKKTCSYSSYTDMIGYDTSLHSSYNSYTGTSGYYYRAYIVLWAEEGGDSEYRYLYTNIIEL